MSKPFEEITEAGFELLEQILEQPDSFPGDFWFDEPTVGGQLELLQKFNLAILDDKDHLSTTELGRAALKHHDNIKEQEALVQKQRSEELELFKTMAESMKQQLDLLCSQTSSTQSIADSAGKQAESAKELAKTADEQAKSAKELAKTSAESSKSSTRYARISTILSIIAIIISIVAIIIQKF